MSDNLRIGILGCGRIGKMHAELVHRQTAGAEVTRVFDVFSASADAVAADLGVSVAVSAAELITADDVDAVAICTSTDTHIDLLVQCAAAGKPVFMEKPLSLDLAEVDRGLAAVNDAGIALQVGFNRRFDRGHDAVRKAVAAGDVGEVHRVHITSRDPEPPPIEYVHVSGGIFRDMTIHDFDMARFVTGSEVVEVYAVGAVMVDPAIGEAGDLDTIVVVMTHENGAITTIDNSRQAVYGYDQRVEVFGSRGMVTSENHAEHHTVFRGPKGSQGAPVPYFFLDRYIPSYLAEWEAFVADVGSGEMQVTGADGRAPLVIGLAALKSVAEKRPVQITEIG